MCERAAMEQIGGSKHVLHTFIHLNRAHIVTPVSPVYFLAHNDHHILVIDETVTLGSPTSLSCQHMSMRLDDYHIHVDHRCIFKVTYNDCYCMTALYPTLL
jgi:hypothetical protein